MKEVGPTEACQLSKDRDTAGVGVLLGAWVKGLLRHALGLSEHVFC